MQRPIVIKIGGSTLGSHDTTLQDVVDLQKKGVPVVVVHGGGKLITDWLSKQGVASEFILGERVTDKPSLDVVVAVLAGLVNKELVTQLNSLGGKAVGISGADGPVLFGKIKDNKLGYVGEIEKVDAGYIKLLLESGYTPVIAPVGYLKGDGDVRLLNVNADTAAGEIGAALGAEKLIFLTDVAGVCDKSGKLIPQMTKGEAQALMDSGVASGGMIPKLKACLTALKGRATACIIDGRQPHALLNEIEKSGTGTTIK
jgi:acetylglutamate kinase